jgi:hypothetical protein
MARQPTRIAFALSLMGTLSIALKLTLPVILRRRSVLGVFSACMRVWPLTFAMFPLLGWLASLHQSKESGRSSDSAWLWLAVGLVLFLSRVGTLTFG